MPHDVKWYIPDRVVIQYYSGILTVEDVRDANHLLGEHIRNGTPLVHSIAHLLDVEKFPLNLIEISRSIEPIDNNLIGWTVAVTQNKMIRFVSSTVSQLFSARFHTVESLEEAQFFLKEHDVSLAELILE